jgi:hypothetical protein
MGGSVFIVGKKQQLATEHCPTALPGTDKLFNHPPQATNPFLQATMSERVMVSSSGKESDEERWKMHR